MPALLAFYGDRLQPKDKSPLAFMKARFGIVDEPLTKGGKAGTPGLYQKLIADKHGKKVTQWVHLPKGKPTVHNDKQADLFNINGTPYQSLETRPGTTDKQLRIGMDALAALKRRVHLLRDSGGSAATLLGSRLYASFVASGHAQLTGQKITSPEDLAALAQVYRDPRFETFRCVFLKGDEVVGESAYSSRLPGTVRLPDNFAVGVWDDLNRFRADGYYMLHNHPSGKATPSDADERLTNILSASVPGFKAHVVIDHHEYGVLNDLGQSTVIQKPDLAGPDYHASPSLDHPMLGVTINNPGDVAMAAKALKSELMDGGPILVMTKGFESRVDVLASVPRALIDTMSKAMPRAKAWLRGIGRASGAGAHAFLVVSDADYDQRKPELRHLVSAGLLVDVVSPGGKSIMLNDYVPYYGPKLFSDKRPGFKVAESLVDDLAAQEKYLTDGAKQLGYADIDDLAVNDYPAFERLAVQWRMDHPVETALYQPVGVYGSDEKALQALLVATPVIVSQDDLIGKHGKELRDYARTLYPDNETETNRISRDVVRFVVRGFKEMKSHSADDRVMQIVPALHDLFKNAIPLWINPDDGTHPGVKLWHHYGVRATIYGRESVVQLAAREMADGTLEFLHYDADVRDLSIVKKAMAGELSTTMQSHSSATAADIYASKDRLLQWVIKIKPTTLTKAQPRIIFFKKAKP
jgi:hypothetical protein